MLGDWYFCCCIKARPEQTALYLSCLDLLDDLDTDSALLGLTYGELRRFDIWMQVYALPRVLRSLQRDEYQEGLASEVDAYLEGLLAQLPEDQLRIFRKLKKAVLGQESAGTLVGLLESCASALHGQSVRSTSPEPYLDLNSFVPQTLLLAVMADRMADDRAFVKAVRDRFQNPQGSSLDLLLSVALGYRRGRLAFRLACLVTGSMVAEEMSGEDLERFARLPKTSVPWEPDLLETLAEVMFLRRRRADPEQIVAALIQESVTLERLRDVRELLPDRYRRWAQAAIERLGLIAGDLTGPTLPLIYWQTTLWALAARAAPEIGAARLAELWQIPSEQYPKEISLAAPYSRHDVKVWRKDLRPLLSLRRHDCSVKLRADSEVTVPPPAARLLYSPWLRLNGDARALVKFDRRNPRYPAVEDAASMIRLLSCALISARLLQTPATDGPDRSAHAALVAHCADALRLFGWLAYYRGEPPNAKQLHLEPCVIALALLARRQLQLAGCGHRESIPPETFLDLLRRHAEETRDADDEPRHTRDEWLLLERLLPEVLINWIRDGYVGAFGDRGSGRWLEHVPEVYEAFSRGKHSRWERINAELLVRFLVPEHRRVSASDASFDWQTARRGAEPVEWQVDNRLLLLTDQELPPDAWVRPDWTELEVPDSDPGTWSSDRRKIESTLTIRAVERLASLERPGLDQATREQWQKGWQARLDRIAKPEDLNRFLRLRLLEILRLPKLEGLAEDRALIALVLFEYGGPFELSVLATRVFEPRKEAEGTPAAAADERVQRALIQAMYRRLELESDREATHVVPIDPWKRRDAQRLIRLIRDLLHAVVVYSRVSGRNRLLQQLTGLHGPASPARAAQTPVDLSLAQHQPTFAPPLAAAGIEHWQLHGAVHDPNELSTTLFFDQVDLGPARNLFGMSRDEIRNLARSARDEPVHVLGIVVDGWKNGCAVNCGESRLVHGKLNPGLKAYPGDWLQLPVRWQQAGQRWQWRFAGTEDQRRLWPKHQATARRTFRVEERESGPPDIYVPKKKGRGWQIPPARLDLDLWYPDLSRAFWPGDKPSYDIQLTEQPGDTSHAGRSGQQFFPVDHDLLHLLLHDVPYAGRRMGILTLIEVQELAHGDSSYRFSARPGLNYLLREEDFVPEAWDELGAAVGAVEERRDGGRGLLVAVESASTSQGVRLGLCRRPPADPNLESRYEGLEAPFDDRNLRWRDLFRDSKLQEAHRVDGAWSIDVSAHRPPGFPDRVGVDWARDHAPRADLSELTVSWRDRGLLQGRVYGEAVSTNQLKLPSGQEADRLRWWLDLDRGTEVELSRGISELRRDGAFLCLIPLGAAVTVEQESLSMRPADRLELPQFFRNSPRRAVVRNARWRRLRPPSIDPDDLPEWLPRQGQVTGIFSKMPKRQQKGSLCIVWWLVGDTARQAELHIHNLSQLSLNPGSRITVAWSGSTWKVIVEARQVAVRALWETEEWSRSDVPLYYLGTVRWRGTNRHIAEAASPPGRLVLLPRDTRPGRHLDCGDGLRFPDRGMPDGWRTTNQADDWVWQEHGIHRRRAILPVGRSGNEVLVGTCNEDSPSGQIEVQDVRLELHGQGSYVLRRFFKLGAVRRRRQVSKARRPARQGIDWATRWQSFRDQPRLLNATYLEKQDAVRLATLKVPADPGQKVWKDTVPLLPDDGPFVAMEITGYRETATVLLCQDQPTDAWSASMRKVPPQSPEQLRRSLTAPYDDLIRLEPRLYYVGPTDIMREGRSVRCHRFEWGPGKTLLVSDARLKLQCQPIDDARFILYHGDAIAAVTFHQEQAESTETVPDLNGESSSDDGCIVVIEELHIQFAESRTLYRQRVRHHIVHVLHLHWTGRDVVIENILGYEVGRTRGALHAYGDQRAELAAEDRTRLRDRFENGKIGGHRGDSSRAVILGRFDDEIYVASYGARVVFQHVRMSFELRSADAAPLLPGELIFMEARRIRPVSRNDRALFLAPLKDIPAADVGKDVKDLCLLRRSFSARQDLLDRVRAESGPAALDGKVVLVRVEKDQDKDRARASFSESIPPRRLRAVAGAIQTNEGVLLATVAASSSRLLRLELEPGIFANVYEDNLESVPAGLQRGAVVRVENAEGGNRRQPRFRITRAAFSQGRYVDSAPRPAVALPKNPLLKNSAPADGGIRNDRYWHHKRQFAIGDLPDVVAAAGWYDYEKKTWRRPRAQQAVALMRTPHPKIVRLGRSGPGEYCVGGPMTEYPAGKLHHDPESKTLEVHIVEPRTQSTEMKWRYATFADESVRSLIGRIGRQGWSYHDAETGHWTDDGVHRHSLKRHRGWQGPLFFEMYDGQPRLRYSHTRLLRFGLPHGALVQSLMASKKRGRFPVAGVSEEGGLWLELAPGRVAEIPAQLLVSQAGNRELSLSSVFWDAFAVGDTVDLRLASRDALTIDRIELEKWVPGPRGALGPGSCFLPVAEWDETAGALTIGAGEYQLTLPVSQLPDREIPCVFLRASNDIEDARSEIPRPGDVVLLQVNDDNDISIAGLRGLQPRTERQNPELWHRDPLADLIKSRADAAALIRGAGGALPVTVEGGTGDLVFFSRRHQLPRSVLPAGQLTIGMVRGGLRPQGRGRSFRALVRFGSALVQIRLDRLVSGLPATFAEAAIDELRSQSIRFWLRGRDESEPATGVEDERSSELEVQPLIALSCEGSGSGLICQAPSSGKLYWMPESDIGWTRMSVEELSPIFLSGRGQLLRSVVIDGPEATPHLSMVATEEAKSELQTLSLSKELTVQILLHREPGPDDLRSYLVTHLRSRIVLEYEHYGREEPTIGEELRAEVIRRQVGERPILVATRLGQRRYTVDLPGWMTAADATVGEVRTGFARYLQWRPEPPRPFETDVSPQLGTLAGEDLARVLVQSYIHLESGAEDPRPGAAAAGEWLKRHLERPELKLHYALIATLLLYRLGRLDPGRLGRHLEHVAPEDVKHFAWQWRQSANSAVREIGRRALRSRHLETLWNQWLGDGAAHRKPGLWRRLPELQRALRPPMSLEDLRSVRRFCRAVDLRNDPELVPIANALRAAIGELRDIEALADKDSVVQQLIRLYRCMPPSRAGSDLFLTDSQAEVLQRLLGRIDSNRLDITLLSPVPRFVDS